MQNGRILIHTVWRCEDCTSKNIVEDAFSGVAAKRRRSSHIMTKHLQQFLCEHAELFFDLVANEVWSVEKDRAIQTSQPLDVKTTSACFAANPFSWEHVCGHFRDIKVYFLWSWEHKGELHFDKKAVTIGSSMGLGEVPLPMELFTDLNLFERLVRRAERETEQTFCTCTYLGIQVGLNKFEPDPSLWHGNVKKLHQLIWIEYKYVRNAETNKPHRVQIRADNWLNKGDRSPGHPLYTTFSRSLRFNIQFMDSFAQNRMDRMEFLGVCYDNPDRPEILRQLPNDIDIQSEQFWWQLPSGETTCKSLIELRDAKLDMLLPEDSVDAFAKVCDELGYDKVGIPKTKDDALRFEEYRASGELGFLIVASVPNVLCYHIRNH